MSVEADQLGSPRVEALGLTHRYGQRTALDDVRFSVGSGEIFALLGPNGGGKSTLFRILATLQPPTAGTARVAGHDVLADPDGVRRSLGVVFQHPSVDAQLTVAENLRAQGALYGLGGAELGRRIEGQLDAFGLRTRRKDRVGTLSGGLARRVEVAKALLSAPPVLLMDEPSAGLDPAARRDLMAQLQRLRDAEGVTVLLTTHHMEEAERCDRVGVIDEGRLVALDTPDGLKSQVGGDVVTIRAHDLDRMTELLRGSFGVRPDRVDGALCFEAERAHEVVHGIVERFGDDVDAVSFGKPTLEDAFFRLTGRRLHPTEEAAA
jgi:ABC-2 type transport system ATP-binding protein